MDLGNIPGVLCVSVVILWDFWFAVILCRGLKVATKPLALGWRGFLSPLIQDRGGRL